jgi:proteic killer suppression protein
MDFKFKDKKLERLYTEETGARYYPSAVVNRFFELMAIIDAAPDEREFYKLKSLHFEKLRGKRENQFSMRVLRLLFRAALRWSPQRRLLRRRRAPSRKPRR